MYTISAMILSGVFDRNRKLKVLSLENDVAWAAAMLERMDYPLRARSRMGGSRWHHVGRIARQK